MIMQISLSEAQARLPDLVKQLAGGDEVVIIDHDEPVARLISQGPTRSQPRTPGSAKGKLRILVEDDEHLDAFTDYMP